MDLSEQSIMRYPPVQFPSTPPVSLQHMPTPHVPESEAAHATLFNREAGYRAPAAETPFTWPTRVELNWYVLMSIPPSAIPLFHKNGCIPQKKLGEGDDGVVVQALSLWKKKTVAIKVIETNESFHVRPRLAPSNEVAALEKVQGHPNIVELYGVEMTKDVVFVVMEFAELGSLDEYIENNVLSESTCRCLFRDLITGIKHCHDNHVVHGDVHIQNLLLDKRGILKLSDFGSALILGDDQLITDDANAFCDIWNAGYSLYCMVYGFIPFLFFFHASLESIMSTGDQLRPGVSDACKDLIKTIVRCNSENWLTPTEILDHPWMKE